MNGILEHVVYKVGVRFYKVIKDLEDLEILLLPFEESTEGHVVRVKVYRDQR